MPIPITAPEVLNREYLLIRAKLLEVAASLDRIGRADGNALGDPRLGQIQEALDVLGQQQDDRAEQVQLLFSRLYDDEWQDKFDIRR